MSLPINFTILPQSVLPRIFSFHQKKYTTKDLPLYLLERKFRYQGIREGLYTNWQDEDLLDVFLFACARNDTFLLDQILSSTNFDLRKNAKEAVEKATYMESVDALKLLLSREETQEAARDSVHLITAALNGNIKIFDLLYAVEGVDPSEDGNRAIDYAQSNLHWEIVVKLLADERVRNDPMVRKQLRSVVNHPRMVKTIPNDSLVQQICDAVSIHEEEG